MPTLILADEDRIAIAYANWQRFTRYETRRDALLETIDWNLMTADDRRARERDDELVEFNHECHAQELGYCRWLESISIDELLATFDLDLQ